VANCWWCHWGWPKPIKDIFNEAKEKLGNYEEPLLFGPAHVVWSDENWSSAQWCLDHFDDDIEDSYYSSEQLAVVRESLERLIAVPDEYKTEPKGYEDDDENPASYPPPAQWVMGRK